MKKALRITTIILALLVIFILPNAVRAQNIPVEDIAGGKDDGVDVILRADGAPSPGGSVRLVFQATPLISAPVMDIQWEIPGGVEMPGSPVEKFTDLPIGQAVTSERVLSFPNPGTYKIAVSANLYVSPSMQLGASGVIFFVIDPLGSSVSDMNPNAHHPDRKVASEATQIPSQPGEEGCFTVTGQIDRIDYPTNYLGYMTPIRIPLAWYEVEIREYDLMFDDSYGTVSTNANGNFSFYFCDDDGWFDDELEIYIRVAAERGDPKVYVEDSSWIDEEYEFETGYISSTGGEVNFPVHLDETWSGIFNIVDAAEMARELWLSSGNSYDEETEIHWEDGYGDAVSKYNSGWNEITIADDPSDPDQWDESVIIHEWGHTTDDYYSCDDSPAESHHWDEVVGAELAWGEGYPDYYQSAVRDAYSFPDSNYYLSPKGGNAIVAINLEDIVNDTPRIRTYQNEMAIAATLWDLYDDHNDSQDQVSYGHAFLQAAYTSEAFMDAAAEYDDFNDDCTMLTYFRGWKNDGRPTDWKTGAVIEDNTGSLIFPPGYGVTNNRGTLLSEELIPANLFRWWKALTYVADNSNSMTGAEFDAMKTVFKKAVNDLGDDPEGTEFTLELFNNNTTTNRIAFAGQFYPETLIGPIDDLTTVPGPDNDCNVYALRALSQGVEKQEKGDVWLFTDGNTIQNPAVADIQQLLNDKRMRASVALMGGCLTDKNENLDQPFSLEILDGLTQDEQLALMNERLALGQAQSLLGPTADDVPSGAVPYLLTAMFSGGQFLYVTQDQLEYAADVLLAQITNSAGAGNWSDYVSDYPTYGWESLASWEYHWIDAMTGGIQRGNPLPNQKLDIPIPGYFQYFSGPYYNTIHIFEDGYATLGLHEAYVPNNTTLPNPAEPNNALYPMWDDLEPYCPPGENNSLDYCEGYIYTLQEGDWYAIEYYKYYHIYDLSKQLISFEILLNLDTGEIRYQYQTVPNTSVSSTIGLEDSNGDTGFQLLHDSPTAPTNNTGYKLTPLPPQPTLTYTVTVDSSMDAVGFLLVGYNGDFEPLKITDPNETLIDCNDASVLCLDLDLVQYVQVNTYGRNGYWHAIVDAGPSGASTFSFTSFAASPITVSSTLNHTLATGTQQFNIQMTGEIDGDMLTGMFHAANGDALGSSINFYDDGLHNDHAAGDGIFGSTNFTTPRAGTGYLTLLGLHEGETFIRLDPVPYTFSPFKLVSVGDGVNYGGVTQLRFQVTNLDIYAHCYWLTYEAPEGWWIDFHGNPPAGCLAAGQTVITPYDVYMSDGYTNNLPSGTTGILTFSATEWEKGQIRDSASARITRHRPPDRIDVENLSFYLRPNGDTEVLSYLVSDSQNAVVADGTPVHLTATGGTITPALALTENGAFTATFTSGPTVGTAYVYAQTDNFVVNSTSIHIANPVANQIELWMSTNQLPADGTSLALLTATVRDHWGNPVANQLVRIGLSGMNDDGSGGLGTIDGGEFASGVTDAYGRFSAKFINSGVVGKTDIRAEMYIIEGMIKRVVHEDCKMMYVGMHFVNLPIVMRK